MSYFAPLLIPGAHMVDTWMTSRDFYTAIKKLEPRLAFHLLYIEHANSLIVAPLHGLATVEKARKDAKRIDHPNRGYAEYLGKLTGEWACLIATGANEHPQRAKLLDGIPKAISGDLPSPPAWTRYFDISLVTGDDGTIHVPSASTLKREFGASSEPAADLHKVLAALDFGNDPRETRGRKPNKI